MKKWLLLSIVLLITSNVFWLYNSFDEGVARTYELADLHSLQKQHKQLMRISNLQLIGKDKQTAIDIIGKDAYGSEPFVKEGCIVAAQICLRLENDIVVEIK